MNDLDRALSPVAHSPSASATQGPPVPVVQPMRTAPLDGTPFWGVCGNGEDGWSALRLVWHPYFKRFVSSWCSLTPTGYWAVRDVSYCSEHDHSPVMYSPVGWLPLPEGMR